MEFLRSLSARHERLKRRIHSVRLPLSGPGRAVMMFLYFSLPIVGGCYVMEWAKDKSVQNNGPHGEKLPPLDEDKKRMTEHTTRMVQQQIAMQQTKAGPPASSSGSGSGSSSNGGGWRSGAVEVPEGGLQEVLENARLAKERREARQKKRDATNVSSSSSSSTV